MPPWKESMEAMLMILPPRPCSTNCRAAAWREKEDASRVDVHHVVPVLLGELDGVVRRMMPALLTRISTRPKASTALATIPATGAVVARSAWMPRNRRPRLSI